MPSVGVDHAPRCFHDLPCLLRRDLLVLVCISAHVHERPYSFETPVAICA